MAVIMKVDGSVEQVKVAKDSLKQLQGIVGGYIQFVPCSRKIGQEKFEGVVCNEEGKLQGLAVNESASEIYNSPYDHLVGDVVWVKKGELK